MSSASPNRARLPAKNGQTRVVVTGMGTVNPLGKDLEEYWHGLIEGRSGASPIERFRSDRLATKFACQVNSFDPKDYLEPKAAKRMARFSQMAVAASGMALADSGLDLAHEDSFRVGVAMGTGVGAFDDMTEGAAALILESREHAINRGARIYGEILGYATTNDAYHQVAPDESGEAPAKAVTLALKDAGLEPSDIDYVNAHGTSTQLNDAGETKALKLALGDYAYRVAISSTKSMIGHLLGASGAVEAIATLLTINRGMIHPTINYDNPDPVCDLDYVPNQARRKDVRIAISNGFGFGGHNAVVVLARYQE